MSLTPRLEAAVFDLYGTMIDIQVDEDSPRLWNGLAAAFRERDIAVEPSDLRQPFRHCFVRRPSAGVKGS